MAICGTYCNNMAIYGDAILRLHVAALYGHSLHIYIYIKKLITHGNIIAISWDSRSPYGNTSAFPICFLGTARWCRRGPNMRSRFAVLLSCMCSSLLPSFCCAKGCKGLRVLGWQLRCFRAGRADVRSGASKAPCGNLV